MVTRAAVRFGSALALFGLTLVAGTLMASPDREFWPQVLEAETPARFAQTRQPLPPAHFQTPVLTASRAPGPLPLRETTAAVVRRDQATEAGALPKPRAVSIAQP